MASRAEQREATRKALRTAGLRCLRRGDYGRLRVRDIAAEAKVATGSFYTHFPSKEALVDDLLAEFNQRLTSRLKAVWDQGALEPSALVRRVAEICLEAWGSERSLLEAAFRRAASAEDLTALRDGINPPVAAFLTAALESAGAVTGSPVTHPALVAQGLLGLWTRVALQTLYQPTVSRAEAVDVLTRMTLGAVFATFAGDEESP